MFILKKKLLKEKKNVEIKKYLPIVSDYLTVSLLKKQKTLPILRYREREKGLTILPKNTCVTENGEGERDREIKN